MSKYPVFKSTNSKLYFIQMGTLCHRFDSCPPDHREVAQLVEQKYCKKMCFVLLNEKKVKLDNEGNLKFITKKTTFNSKIEARTWIARYGNYKGEIISIYQNNSYAPFLVDNKNELVPLQTGEEKTADFNIIDGGAADTNY